MTSVAWVRFRHSLTVYKEPLWWFDEYCCQSLISQTFLHKSHQYFFFRSIQREKKNILELLKRRQDAQEEELKQNLKLEQDVEMEKLRKVKQPFLCVNKLEFISGNLVLTTGLKT